MTLLDRSILVESGDCIACQPHATSDGAVLFGLAVGSDVELALPLCHGHAKALPLIVAACARVGLRVQEIDEMAKATLAKAGL